MRLKKPEKEILKELRKGDRTKGFLEDETGKHRNTIYRALERLEAADVVECLHEGTALYTLKRDPEEQSHY